jgi:precorrin-6B C5,15-methyltransferase / cobalt-precorrin-6B C5,C15-methyltransferase
MSRARWLCIVGIGEDGVEGLSRVARTMIAQAAFVVGGARHLALADTLIAGARMAWPHPIEAAFPAILSRRGEAVVVLASGDPYCFGIGATLARVVPMEETLCLPAQSAFSLACATLGWALNDTATLSFCGRPVSTIAPHLQPGSRILALSADATTPAAVAALLRERGFGASRLHVLEALGGPRARCRSLLADAAMPADVGALNLVGIEVETADDARVIPLSAGLADEFFEHDGQITKREIRALTLSALQPRRGELLWDIGSGSGSVSIEWMLRHPANRAIAIERNPERATRAVRNAASLGVPALKMVEGAAPQAIADLPVPDAVFIGGGAHVPGVIDAAWRALRQGGRIVANGVTAETEMALFAAANARGGTLIRLSVERLDRIGSMHAFRPAMTVTQWAATKP